jgi:hypothetical protein
MTEAEWLAATDPILMLNSLSGTVSERKLRLFACSCCRRVWEALPGEGSREAVEIAERYADGREDDESLSRAQAIAASEINPEAFDKENPAFWATSPSMSVDNCIQCSGWSVSFASPSNVPWDSPEVQTVQEQERIMQAGMLRCVFGNPFRRAGTLREFRTEAMIRLAEEIYREQAFDRLPILAEALQDAGCDDADLLGHLRGPGPHVRGCWALDLLLGKS